jgi:ABC-type bacteriocin/lantibiotic exporter with double-glycine peptidase domain
VVFSVDLSKAQGHVSGSRDLLNGLLIVFVLICWVLMIIVMINLLVLDKNISALNSSWKEKLLRHEQHIPFLFHLGKRVDTRLALLRGCLFRVKRLNE